MKIWFSHSLIQSQNDTDSSFFILDTQLGSSQWTEHHPIHFMKVHASPLICSKNPQPVFHALECTAAFILREHSSLSTYVVMFGYSKRHYDWKGTISTTAHGHFQCRYNSSFPLPLIHTIVYNKLAALQHKNSEENVLSNRSTFFQGFDFLDGSILNSTHLVN